MTLGEKIRDAREMAELTQNAVADLIPMNQSNYSKIERDIQEPNIYQLRRICQILKLSPAYLLELDDYENFSRFSKKDMEILRDIKQFLDKHSS